MSKNKVKKVKKERKERFIRYRFVSTSCAILMLILYKVKVHGKQNAPRKGPFLLICNHQSFLDPFLCDLFIPGILFFLARDTLYKGWFGKFLIKLNTYPIKRGESDLKAMREMIKRLKQGHGVCLFPEGTRSADGRISDIKSGFILLSKRADAPVVPMVIEGLHEIWPKEKKCPKFFGSIAVEIGEPISYAEIEAIGQEKFGAVITDKLRKLQNQARESLNREPIDYSKEE